MLPAVQLVRETIAQASVADLALAGSYALIAVAGAAEGVELAVREGRQRVERWPVAAVMGVGGLVAGTAVTTLYGVVWPRLLEVSPDVLSRPAGHAALGWVLAFVLWDAAGYAYHRVGHATAVGWASHQVHHAGERYDLSLAWRQSWFPLHAVAVFPLVALAGVELPVAATCAAASNVWQALLHTHREVRLPRALTAVVMTPATHRRHHLVDGPAVNLGPVLTVWDRLTGTWDPSPVPSGARCGTGRPDRGGALRCELAGWVELVRVEHLDADPLVPLALRLGLHHPDPADLVGARHVGAAVGLAVEADDVDDADLRDRRRDEVDLGADEVLVPHGGVAGQEGHLHRSGGGQLFVHETLDGRPEVLR